jgi:large subunit ribosomal protein L21
MCALGVSDMKKTYAIVETGGRQYKVHAGNKIKVDYLGVDEGKEVELSKVLLINDGDNLILGNPVIEHAKVTATCVGEGRDKKIIVFRYKSKTRHRVKNGHRQPFTTLQIKDIVKPGKKAAKKESREKEPVGGES